MTVIDQLTTALDAARASGQLRRDAEPGCWLVFELPEDEYRSHPGAEVVEDGGALRWKVAYSEDGFAIFAEPERSEAAVLTAS